MTRIGKQEERRAQSPKRPKLPGKKTGPKKDNLPEGYKLHLNALDGELAKQVIIKKVK